ncbi:MAG TPA: hypothetical protein VG938_20490 [Verrucomicrobiae bacterium]|jgi:hypothetical protein|nr:hypothetical protein [Verrucomicrobiae bacterium]
MLIAKSHFRKAGANFAVCLRAPAGRDRHFDSDFWQSFQPFLPFSEPTTKAINRSFSVAPFIAGYLAGVVEMVF